MRLVNYIDKNIDELQEKYELVVTDLANTHESLADALSALHGSYLESFSHSRGKSVAERNRDADYDSKETYQEIILTRGRINQLSELRDMLLNIISWKMELASFAKPTYSDTYPLDYDKDRLGHT